MEDIKVPKSERLTLSMDVELLDRIEVYRFSNKYSSRSAAIRDLLIFALEQIDDNESENPQKSEDKNTK